MIVYRILSFVVNFFCAFLAMMTLFGLLFSLANPVGLFQCFIMGSVVLYGWFANRFYVFALVGKQKMTRRQKDWLQVNAIVALIFSSMGVVSSINVVYYPEVLENFLKNIEPQASVSTRLVVNAAIISLFFCTVLLIHIVWTYVLIKKNKEYFE